MIHSISYCTANEDGVEEITICRDRTLLEWCKHMLASGTSEHEITEVYVVDGTQWMDKITRVAPDFDKQYKLYEIKSELKRQSSQLTA